MTIKKDTLSQINLFNVMKITIKFPKKITQNSL